MRNDEASADDHEAVKHLNAQDRLQVLDIAEIAAQAL